MRVCVRVCVYIYVCVPVCPLQSLLGHTVFALSFARVFELVFWVASFTELTSHSGSRAAGYVVLTFQMLQLIIMADFFYYYISSVTKGTPMVLPTTITPGGGADV